MSTPLKVQIVDIVEYSSNEIKSIKIEFNDGHTVDLLPYEFKYLHKTKPDKSPYDTIKEIGTLIDEIVGYCPRQISDLFNFIKSNKTTDTIKIVFTEEIKDGRTSKFNFNAPLSLKNKILRTENFVIKINSIIFDEMNEQPSDNNQYFDYSYKVDITKM